MTNFIKIVHGSPCDSIDNAESLATHIEKYTGVMTDIVPGAGHIFEVHFNGSLIYTNEGKENTFPREMEIFDHIKANFRRDA